MAKIICTLWVQQQLRSLVEFCAATEHRVQCCKLNIVVLHAAGARGCSVRAAAPPGQESSRAGGAALINKCSPGTQVRTTLYPHQHCFEAARIKKQLMLCIYPHTWRMPDALCWLSYMCTMLPASMHEQFWLLYDAMVGPVVAGRLRLLPGSRHLLLQWQLLKTGGGSWRAMRRAHARWDQQANTGLSAA